LEYNGPLQCFDVGQHKECLSAKKVVNDEMCYTSKDCGEYSICVVPVNQVGVKMIKLSYNGTHLLYSGSLYDLYSIQITDNLLKFIWPLTEFDIPTTLEIFFQDLFSLSSALSILNLAPVYYLDGEHAFGAFIKYFFPFISDHKRHLITKLCFIFVSTLLLATILISLIKL